MIFREEDVGGRERVTTDEERVARGGLIMDGWDVSPATDRFLVLIPIQIQELFDEILPIIVEFLRDDLPGKGLRCPIARHALLNVPYFCRGGSAGVYKITDVDYDVTNVGWMEMASYSEWLTWFELTSRYLRFCILTYLHLQRNWRNFHSKLHAKS